MDDLAKYLCRSNLVSITRFGAVGTINFEKCWIYAVFAATNAFNRGFDSEKVDALSFFRLASCRDKPDQ